MRIAGVLRAGPGRVGQRLEAAAIGGVGGVGHQLAEEDFALGVERVDDEIEQTADLGAELVAFFRGGGGCFRHGIPLLGLGGGRDMRQAGQFNLRRRRWLRGGG